MTHDASFADHESLVDPVAVNVSAIVEDILLLQGIGGKTQLSSGVPYPT